MTLVSHAKPAMAHRTVPPIVAAKNVITAAKATNGTIVKTFLRIMNVPPTAISATSVWDPELSMSYVLCGAAVA